MENDDKGLKTVSEALLVPEHQKDDDESLVN